jgi:hypothetical protein
MKKDVDNDNKLNNYLKITGIINCTFRPWETLNKTRIKLNITQVLPVYGCETWSLTLREERRLRVFENRVLRRIFGPKRDEIT